MNQVQYNARYHSYKSEIKAAEAKWQNLKDQVEPGSPEETALEEKEEAEIQAIRDKFNAETAGKIE